METYGWTIQHIDELTYDQIRLWAHLAWKGQQRQAQLHANKTAELIAKMMGG